MPQSDRQYDPRAALPMVLLRHTTPAGGGGESGGGSGGGGFHFDWVLGRCGIEEAKRSPDIRDAVTIRLGARPDGPDDAGAEPRGAQRLPDHRRRYLWIEGELSQGRGTIERVATGLWWGPEVGGAGDDGALRFRARFEGEPGETRWELGPDGLARVAS